MYGSKLWTGGVPSGTEVEIGGMSKKAVVHKDGLLVFGNDGKAVNVKQLQFDSGKMISASKYGQAEEDLDVEFSAEEQQMADNILV